MVKIQHLLTNKICLVTYLKNTVLAKNELVSKVLLLGPINQKVSPIRRGQDFTKKTLMKMLCF